METKFTKGPWVTGAAPYSNDCVYIDEGDGRTGACLAVAFHDTVTRDEANANASLIAAAPAMFEALERVQAGLVDCHWSTDRAIDPDDKIDAILKLARGSSE